jgi:CMP-N,N'-diacetyllegionaminic acid synthase
MDEQNEMMKEMNDDINILGIIPARAGSKRIIGKNIKSFAGKPLINYTFEAAKKSKLLTKVIVSTNDSKVIELAKENNIEVPFIRPEIFCDDYATDKDWVNHAVNEMKLQGFQADYVVILRPTSPFKTTEKIDQAIKTIIENKTDSLRSLTKVQHHPYWMKQLDGSVATPFIDLGKPDEKLRSQDLPPLYRLNGVVDVLKVDNINTDSLYGESMSYILLDEEQSLDIDTLEEFEWGELLYNKKKENNVDGVTNLLIHPGKENEEKSELCKVAEKKKIVLFCARMDAHAGVVLDIITNNNLFEVVGFFDDNPELIGKKLNGIPILGTIRDFPQGLIEDVQGAIVCTGNNDFKASCYNKIKETNLSLVNVIHPSAIISPNVELGEGVFIGPKVIINNNTIIGNNVLINTAAVIEHDNIIEDHAFIGPGCNLAGRVKIKKKSFLGIGVNVIPDIIIGENVLVGAGAVIINDVGDNQKVAGVPARKIGGGKV